MDSRLVYAGCALFFAAYAQLSPLFSLFGVKVDSALVLAIFFAFFVRTFFEGAFLVVCAAFGLAYGIGLIQSLLFFSAIFVVGQGVRRVVPWQPFLSGCTLVLFFSFLTYVSFDWGLVIRFASQFAREALYNIMLFALVYFFLSRYYARQGRY